MKKVENMSIDELKAEIQYIASLDDQLEYQAAYLAELANALAKKAWEE